MNALKLRYFLFLLGLFGIVVACDDDTDFSVTPAIGFQNVTGQIAESAEVGQMVTFHTNSKITEPITLTVNVSNIGGVVYGKDYTTVPETVDNKITVTIRPDETDAGFLVYPKVYDGTAAIRKVNFELTGVTGANLAVAETSARYYALEITKDIVVLSTAFEDCSTNLSATFTEQIVPGAMTASTWACTNFGYLPGSTTAYTVGVEANAFGKGDGTTNAYLVSKKIETGDNSKLVVSAMVMSWFSGVGTVKLKYSTNYTGSGNPEAAGVTWTELKTANAAMTEPGKKEWKKCQEIIEGVADKTVYIAIQYAGGVKGGSGVSVASWRIDDFNVTARK